MPSTFTFSWLLAMGPQATGYTQEALRTQPSTNQHSLNISKDGRGHPHTRERLDSPLHP